MLALATALVSAFVLQGQETVVNNISWGVYYNNDTLSCYISSVQDDKTVLLRKGMLDINSELTITSNEWNFTYDKESKLPVRLKFYNGREFTLLVTHLFSKKNPKTIAVKIHSEQVFRYRLVSYTVQFNNKNKLTIDTAGMLELREEFIECMRSMYAINSIPLKKQNRLKFLVKE